MRDTDITSLWAEINRRLDAQDMLIQADRVERRNRAAVRSTRWAVAGQIGQIAYGILVILTVSGLWAVLPTDPTVILCGVLVHLYAIATILMAGRAIALIRKIDFDRPLLEAQLSLAKAEKALALSRMVAGLPWWFLWLAIPVVLVGRAGIALSAKAASWVLMTLAFSALGMITTLAIRAWLIRRGIIKEPVGRQLTAARHRLDEIMEIANDPRSWSPPRP